MKYELLIESVVRKQLFVDAASVDEAERMAKEECKNICVEPKKAEIVIIEIE